MRAAPGVLTVLLLGSIACEKRLPPLGLEEGCQPLLGGSDCLLPYPSDFFRTEAPDLPSGFEIRAVGPARITSRRGASADLTAVHRIDGFSRLPVLTVSFSSGLAAEGLPGILDPPEGSATTESRSLLMDAETGEFVPHFVDLDPLAEDPSRQAVVIHPWVALRERSRYVVALKGLVLPGGDPVPTPEGFRRLRDRETAGDFGLEAMAKRFEREIFGPLVGAGVNRRDLQLAWDFTTGSDDHRQADMLRVRALTLEWLATHTPQVTISRIEENASTELWRTVEGTVTGPLFMTSPEGGALLFRDAEGRVSANGTATFPFLAQVPASVRDQFEPGRALSFGHGFFGSRTQLNDDSMRHLADRLKAVVFSIDWWGMCLGDVASLADALSSRPAHALDFTDRVHQAMANWMVMGAAVRGPLAQEPAFRRPLDPAAPGVRIDTGGASNAGQGLYEPASLAFLGASQGHILGGTLAALDPTLSRVVLHVGGAGLGHMLFRARPFGSFLLLLQNSIKDPYEQQRFAATAQEQFDRIDPATYAPLVLESPLSPSPPDRRVLMQIGLGDTEVPNLGSFLHARLLGLTQLGPTTSPVFGLGVAEGPIAGSALVVHDFHFDLQAIYGQARAFSEYNGIHGGLRWKEPVLSQMDLFLAQGLVANTCSGPCDPY